jgi:hypothetical protein
MKTLILSVSILFFSLLAEAQVWAPSGATWHYDWVEMATDGYAKVEYINDSIVGGKLCKVLKIEKHTYNWITHTYSNGVLGYEYTYLENNIVYYYRYGQFFKLYDFNSIAGNSWEVAGWEQDNPCDSTGIIVVDSTGITNINSFSLKYLCVSPGQNSEWEFYFKIIERIGCLGYMFPGPNCAIDIPGPGQLRCYYDDEFGLYQRTGFPPACDYITGVDNNHHGSNDIKIYPVPASSTLTVETTNQIRGDFIIVISDILGREIMTLKTNNVKFVINTESLKDGIYLLKYSDKKYFSIKKFAVNH